MGTPGTIIRFHIYPTIDVNFTVSVAEDLLPPPGNKPLQQLIRFDPSGGGGGGGGGGSRALQFSLQGPPSYSEAMAGDIPLSLKVFMSSQQKQYIGNMLTALNGRSFSISGAGIGREWSSSTWPAAYYDDATTTYYFNITAHRGYPRITVQLNSFPNATFGTTTPAPIAIIGFSSQNPTVGVGIEAPAYYVASNRSGTLVPNDVFVVIRLDTPILSPSSFLPGHLSISNADLVGNSAPTRVWNYTDGQEVFVAKIRPHVSRTSATPPDAVVTVNSGSMGFPQSNHWASRIITYQPGADNAAQPTVQLTAPPNHNGEDSFLLTMTTSDPVRPLPSMTSDSQLQQWLMNQLVVLNGYDQVFGELDSAFPGTVFTFQITPKAEADINIVMPSNSFALPGNERATTTVPYSPTSQGASLPTINAVTVHQGPTGRGADFDGILVTIDFSKEMPGISNLAVSRVVLVEGGSIRDNQWTIPFSSQETTFAQLEVLPDSPTDIVITVPANVLGASGTPNVAAKRTIRYTPAPATVIITGPWNHQGAGSTAKFITSFDRPVANISADCLAVSSGAHVSEPQQEDADGRDYSFEVHPDAPFWLTVQVQSGCVDAVGEDGVQNYASKVLQVPYVAPPPTGKPATLSVIAPRLHDGSESFKVTLVFDRPVFDFSANSIRVSPYGVVNVGGADHSGFSSHAYEVQFFFRRPQTASSRVALNVSVPANVVEGGNTPAWASVKWDQYGPAPSPLPSPSSPCQGVTCSGHGQCRAVQLPGSDVSTPDCECQPGYSGYNCETEVPAGAASCFDGRQDGGESDVDCGGPCARRCTTGFQCATSNDCEASAQCYALDGGNILGSRRLGWSRSLSLVGAGEPGVCQTTTIGGGGAAEVVVTMWVLEGVSRTEIDTMVTGTLRTRVVGYINSGAGGAAPPSTTYGISDVLITNVSSWRAPPAPSPSPSTSPGATLLGVPSLRRRSRMLQSSSQTSGVSLTVQVNAKQTDDAPSIRSVLRSVQASG